MDYLTIDGKDKDVNILVVTYHFTRFSQVFSGFCYAESNSSGNSQNFVGTLLCVLWHT